MGLLDALDWVADQTSYIPTLNPVGFGIRTYNAATGGDFFEDDPPRPSGPGKVLSQGADPRVQQQIQETLAETMATVQETIARIRAAQLRERRGAARDRRHDQMQDDLDELIGSLSAPNLADYVGGFDAAEGQAKKTYDAALPVIDGQQAALMQALARYAGESRRDAGEAGRETARSGRQAVAESRGLSQSILGDLMAQTGGEAVSGLVTGAQQEAATQEQGIRENFRSEQALNRDLTRNEQSSIRDQRGGAQQVHAAALADARNNLDAILGQIGIERAGAQGQYNQDLQAFQQRIAELRFGAEQDFRESEQARGQQRREMSLANAAQRQEQALQIRQETATATNDLMSQITTAVENGQDPVEAFELLMSTYGPGLASGDNPSGLPLDVERIAAQVQAYLATLQGQQEEG